MNYIAAEAACQPHLGKLGELNSVRRESSIPPKILMNLYEQDGLTRAGVSSES